MDYFRRRPSTELALGLAHILSEAFPQVCKESAFMVNWLLEHRDALGVGDAAEMALLQSRLSKLRADGNEGLV